MPVPRRVSRIRWDKPKHANKKTTKAWPRYTQRERRAIFDRCGSEAFLDPRRLKYPLVSPDCRPDCRGIRTAKQRAAMHAPHLVARADAAGRAGGCRWARRGR